jgi:hypothetical protein
MLKYKKKFHYKYRKLCLLTKRSGQSENIQTDLSKEPEAKYLPSQLHPTLCTFAE